MSSKPTVKLSPVFLMGEEKDEFFILIADEASVKTLANMIEALNEKGEEEIANRTLSFSSTPPKLLMMRDMHQKYKDSSYPGRPLEDMLLQEFSNFLFNSLVADNILQCLSDGFFDIKFIEFDQRNTFLYKALNPWIDKKGSITFSPNGKMIMEAISGDKDWEQILKRLIDVKETPNGLIFTSKESGFDNSVTSISPTLH